MQMHPSVFSVAFAMALAATPAPAATFYLTTGLGTHVTTIGPTTPASWSFFADLTHSHFAGAVFAMKYDGSTSFGINMELLDNSTEMLASVSYANAVQFIGAGGSSVYTKFTFLIDNIGYALSNGFQYTVKVSLVDNAAPGSQSYSISGFDGGANFRLTDDPATIIVTEAISATATPEPASALVVAAGLLCLGLARRHARTAAT